MSENPSIKKEEGYKAILSSIAMQMAQVQALLALIEVAFQKLGLDEIDGLSVSQWHQQRLKQEVENVLIGMENFDPAGAALIQQHLDEIKKKLGSQGK
jgi:hypothetical protein